MLVSEYMRAVAAELKNAGIGTYLLDSEILVSHALNTDRFRLLANCEKSLAPEEMKEIDRLVKRRLRFEPVAYITQRKEFYSLEFFVNRSVLIPRPETELLVDLVIYYAPQNGSVIDLGTGSGAIAVAVKHNRADCVVYGTDISRKALRVASANARAILGCKAVVFKEGDLFNAVSEESFDIIVSNPPYVDREKAEFLQKDLLHEPEVALFAGDHGRETIRKIVYESKDHLHPRGIVLVEIGEEMKDFIADLGNREGFSVSVLNDHAGLPRVAVLKSCSGQ